MEENKTTSAQRKARSRWKKITRERTGYHLTDPQQELL